MSEKKLKEALKNWQNKLAYLEKELSIASYLDFSKKDYINMLIQEHKFKINEISEQIKLISIPDTEEIKEETKKVEYMIDKQVGYEKLGQALKNWQDKLAHFEYELSYTASAEKKFELRKCIEECDTAIQRLKTTIFDLEQKQQKQQPNSPSIPQIVRIELKSENGVDYSQLRDLLAAGKWKEADEETARVMCLAAGREEEGWLRTEDIDNFPCEDLRTINQLWLHYSNGKFGFSVQKEIYQSLGGTREYNEEVWWKFYDRVGWLWVEGELMYWGDLTFHLERAAQGHLPFWGDGDYIPERLFPSLVQRLVTCRI